MPDVQSRQLWPESAQAPQYGSRSAVSLSPLARQPSRPRDRGGQVGSVRASFASVHRTADRHGPPRISRPHLLLERDRPDAQVGRIRKLLQRAPGASLPWRHHAGATRLRIFLTDRACCPSPIYLEAALSRSVSHTDSGLSTNSPRTGSSKQGRRLIETDADRVDPCVSQSTRMFWRS